MPLFTLAEKAGISPYDFIEAMQYPLITWLFNKRKNYGH